MARPIIWILVAALLGCVFSAKAQKIATLELSVVPTTSVATRSGTGASNEKTGTTNAELTTEGTENIEPCRKKGEPEGSALWETHGRHSSMSANAVVTDIRVVDSRTASFRMSVRTRANGGHYLKGFCIEVDGQRKLMFFSPNDTTATASARATTLVRIRFAGGRPGVPYFLKISNARTGVHGELRLFDPDGNEVELTKGGGGSVPFPLIFSRPGQEFLLQSSVWVDASDKGGCCDQRQDANAAVSIELERAPLLFASEDRFIAGGKQTQGHANVGVVLIDGLPHCTATLISGRTLLTAAHCVEGHMTRELVDKRKILVAFGSVYSQPAFPPIAVVEYDYPKSNSLNFDPDTLEHDIAVLQLERSVDPTGARPAMLHRGAPAWDSIKSKATNLIFVGFGFNVVQGDKVGLGIKREASWSINGYDDQKISFSVPGTNTCKGDSGGPGFIEDSASLLLAAITSGGNSACTTGFNTRVDHYLSWIDSRIK